MKNLRSIDAITKLALLLVFGLTLTLIYSPSYVSSAPYGLHIRVMNLTWGDFSSYEYEVWGSNGTDYVKTEFNGTQKACTVEFELWNPSGGEITVTSINYYSPWVHWFISLDNSSINITPPELYSLPMVQQITFAPGSTYETLPTVIKFELENLTSLPDGYYFAIHSSSLDFNRDQNYGVTFIQNDNESSLTYEHDIFYEATSSTDDTTSLDTTTNLFTLGFLSQITILLLIAFAGFGFSRKKKN